MLHCTINSRTELFFLLLYTKRSNKTWHIPCCMQLTFSCNINMNFGILLFLLLFRIAMEQAQMQDSAGACNFSLLKEFPLLKFINGCLQRLRKLITNRIEHYTHLTLIERSFFERTRPIFTFTPKSFTMSISKLTIWYGKRYCGISEELEEKYVC